MQLPSSGRDPTTLPQDPAYLSVNRQNTNDQQSTIVFNVMGTMQGNNNCNNDQSATILSNTNLAI
jgi:hypothetical protein